MPYPPQGTNNTSTETPSEPTGESLVELMQQIAPSGTGWRTYNLSGYGVPANAKCDFVLSNNSASRERSAGIRPVGSGLSRTFTLHEAEAGGADHVSLSVNADVSSQVEGYADSTSDVRLVLVGYRG
jgi:hypothetical protein